jgi:hypothetical protein
MLEHQEMHDCYLMTAKKHKIIKKEKKFRHTVFAIFCAARIRRSFK